MAYQMVMLKHCIDDEGLHFQVDAAFQMKPVRDWITILRCLLHSLSGKISVYCLANTQSEWPIPI